MYGRQGRGNYSDGGFRGDGGRGNKYRRRGGARGGRRGGHPQGLRGKEIGLWYAQKCRERKDKDECCLPVISMNASQVRDVGRMLDSFDGGSNSSGNVSSFEGASSVLLATDDLGEEWDNRISSIMAQEFEDDGDKEKRPLSETFARRLENINESDFKRAYMANVHGNQVNQAYYVYHALALSVLR
ncbi:ATP-dependent DNA/RNA helicase DHX36-like [Cherax quadricarinatus]|uniref:ATP-dependent DNA/RNA helicase DHX36-like n=1 Tax=Cherax quadricarinatus TaxID=27406 RepID=UPI00387EA94D